MKYSCMICLTLAFENICTFSVYFKNIIFERFNNHKHSLSTTHFVLFSDAVLFCVVFSMWKYQFYVFFSIIGNDGSSNKNYDFPAFMFYVPTVHSQMMGNSGNVI